MWYWKYLAETVLDDWLASDGLYADVWRNLGFNNFVGDTSFSKWGFNPISFSSHSSFDVNFADKPNVGYVCWLNLEGLLVKDTVLPDIGKHVGSSNSSVRRITAFLTRFVELVDSPRYCPILFMLVVESLGELLGKHAEGGISDEYICCEEVDRVRKDDGLSFSLPIFSFLIPFNRACLEIY